MGAKKALTNLILLMSLLSFGMSNSYAASSNCVKALHKQAIMDAINMSPVGLRNIIKPFESKMLDRIPALHAEAPNDRSFKHQDYYKRLIETLRDQDPKRNDYLARMLTGITIYPLSKYLPIRPYDSCDDARIIKETDIIFDGYDEQPNYSMLTNDDFAESKMKYEGRTETERMKVFYNLLVNEIVDLWSNVWLQAGNRVDDLPVAGSVIREAAIKKQTANRIQALAPQTTQNENTTEASFSDADLSKYKNPTDSRSADAISSTVQRFDLGQGYYGNMGNLLSQMGQLAAQAGRRKATINDKLLQSQLQNDAATRELQAARASAIRKGVIVEEAQIPVAPIFRQKNKIKLNGNIYDQNSLANPYGAGSPYKSDGLMNPYSQYGSSYSNKSWTNPYATDAPKLYDNNGNYRGRLSNNPYDADSISNPYGRYGSKYSSESINNPYGAGNPYSVDPIYVVPQK